MNVGSLFTGIGGFDLGLERAGMRVVWQCEQDEFCRRVLARHWPGVPCYPDVRALVADTDDGGRDGRRTGGRDEEPLAERAGHVERRRAVDEGGLVPVPVPPVDVLCGGFPCQDISLAGKGAGIDGERSGLWGEYARLVGELRPRYVIVENVAALLARGLDRVLGDLAALGYDAEWDCLPASAFGAPHRRDRLWLVAYPNSDTWGREASAQLDSEPSEDPAYGDSRWRHVDGLRDEVADAERGGRQGWPQDTGRGSPEREASEWREGASESARCGAEAGALADAESLTERTGLRADEPRRVGRGRPSDSGSEDVQDADERALLPWRVGGRAAQTGGAEWWAVEPPVGRVAHGVPDRLDQLAALGNALVPQIAEWLGEQLMNHERSPVPAGSSL